MTASLLRRVLLLSVVLCALPALASLPANRKQRLCEGWEFIRQDMANVWEVMRPVPGAGKPEAVPLWHPVTLPHCYNATDGVAPDVSYYQGAAWYRTSLALDNPYAGGRILLEFEGAGQTAEVYVYTRLVATHVGGYDEWTADITEAVEEFRSNPVCARQFKGRIPIAIRCTNTRNTELIPSDMSDFNLYGGLYRYVNLVYLPATYIEDVCVDAQTDERGRRGELAVDVSLSAPLQQDAQLRVEILSPEGKTLHSATPEARESGLHSLRTSLPKPALWSPGSPALYTYKATLTVGGDTVCTEGRFGFRHFRFEEHGPFYLNGSRLLLRGTHRHEDHAGVGAALTEEMMRREMIQIKEMGANFIRLGHYQQSRIVLDLCDSLGILVWEEIPWCRGGLGGETYRAQARRMLTNMITQHCNHPSIILWGLGNENDWPGDFPHFDKDSIRAFMGELHALSHRLDPSRLTSIRRCDFCKDIVDVYSPTIWAGWYSRRYRDYRTMSEGAFQSTPRFLHAEWGGDSHAGCHTEPSADRPASRFDELEAGDRNGDWSESYIVRLFDWHLKEQEQMPWLTGSAFWTFKDFSTPLRPDNPIPYVNQKGVVQRDGTPKESYYVFQSYWTDKPMVHIYGHTWPVRWGKADEDKEILVYSNCPEVELFVNGVSQGRRVRNSEDFPAAGLHWNVRLQAGENQIRAVAYHGKKLRQELIDEVVQQYVTEPWGAPHHLRLTRLEGDLLQAEVLDAEGRRCLDAACFIRFRATDPDALFVDQGTATGSSRIQAANGRACIRLLKGKDVAISAYTEDKSIKSAIIQF